MDMFASNNSTLGRALLVLLLLACHVANESHQHEMTSTTNQDINISNQEETIKFGNTKTNNYNFHESNYQPMQSTQVVFNVGKWKPKKLRSLRPPTSEEFAIKQSIMDVYQAALDETSRQSGVSSPHLEHLGRIIMALNPKYISTRRVMDIVFADPYNSHAAHRRRSSGPKRSPESGFVNRYASARPDNLRRVDRFTRRS
jgi:hypothetical protein